MRALFGLAVPLLLLFATFTSMAPQAAAETTYYTISGRVVSDQGVPLEGARVNGYTYPEEGDRRVTADSGEIRQADAIADAEGKYSLKLAAGKGWINVYYEKWRQGDGREIVVDSNTTVDLTLRTPPPKDAIVEGRVVDEDGEPVSGAEVSLQTRCCYAIPAEDKPVSSGEPDAVSSGRIAPSPIVPPQWDDHATTTTDADGRFRFEAYAGPHQIVAWAKGYAQSIEDVDAVAGDAVEVEIGLEKVPPADAVLAGRVIDAQTGLPLARAQVSLRSLEWGRYAWAETGPDGEFRLTTIPGWAEISVHYYAYAEPMPLAEGDVAKPMIAPAPSGAQYYPFMTLVDLSSGENQVDAPLDPKPKPTIALLGYVVDPETKKAVPDARVSVSNHETGDWGEAITDATGSFRIMVRAGHYSGTAYKEGYLGGTQSFRVTDEAAQRIDILMPRGTTKWAPCYEDDASCGGGIAYARGAELQAADAYSDENATSTGAPAPAPAVAPTAGGLVAAEGDASAPGIDRSRGASFSGEGGGLPPYDPDARRTVPASERADPQLTPGHGALVAALALAAAAFVAVRRR